MCRSSVRVVGRRRLRSSLCLAGRHCLAGPRRPAGRVAVQREAVPQRRGLQLRVLAVAAVGAGEQHLRRGGAVRCEQAPARARAPVGERQQRLARALVLRVDAVDTHRPRGVRDARRQRAAHAGASCASSSCAKRAGPPPSASTPAGTPAGSGPTETTVALAACAGHAAASRCPGRPPSGPSSSPTISTCAGATPRSHWCAKYHRAESDLSVRPISTCLASLVTRGSASPASTAAASLRLDRGAQVLQAVGAQPRLHGGEQLGKPRLRGVGPLRQRDQVDLAAVQALRDDLGVDPLRTQALDGERGGAVERRLLRGGGDAALHPCTPSASTLKTSEPRLSSRCSSPGPRGRAASWPSTFSRCVPLATATSRPCAHAASIAARTAPASAARSGTAVPSQSKSSASRRARRAGGRGAASVNRCRRRLRWWRRRR